MNREHQTQMAGKSSIDSDETGIVTAMGLLVLVALTLLGATAVMITGTDILIGGNYKASERAFYAAEAGIEEARARLRADAANPINDAHPTQTQWRAYVGVESKAQSKGYNSGNTMHLRTASSQSELDYTVEIRHQTDSAGNILYWGDPDGDGINARNTAGGQNIYLISSYGASGSAGKTLELETARIPPITVPAALYVEATTTVQGAATNINGQDRCGSADKPGVATTLADGSVTQNGNPTITGTGGTPSIAYNRPNLDVDAVVNTFKKSANFTYSVTSATQSGMNWGTPTAGARQQDPNSCSVNNIVHYDTAGTYVKLTGDSSGCGILLVEGDLEIHGGFSWYGIVIATGSVVASGGGNKNITGAILAGGSAVADVIGGNTSLVFCSDAVNNQTQNRPLMVLSWRER